MTKQQMKKAIEKAASVQIAVEKAYKSYYKGMITLNDLNSTLAGIIASNKSSQHIINAMLHVISYGINTSNQFRIAEIFNLETSDYIKMEIEKTLQNELYFIQQDIQSA